MEHSREPAYRSGVPDRHHEYATVFGLTAAQISIWFDQGLHPGKPIYNTGQVISINGDVDVARFAEAVRQVISDNGALRLRFLQESGRVFQEIVPELSTPWIYRDFLDDADPTARAAAWLEGLFWRPLRPGDFPLFEFALARVAADRFLWLQKYHHLIIDATGRQLVAARVAAAYNAPPGAGERAGSLVSFYSAKAAEDEYLASPQYAIDEAYWKQRLRDVPAACVKVDKKFSERSRSGRPARLDFELGPQPCVGLRAFALAQKSSIFKVVLCLVWSCYSRMFASSDLIVGVPVANRRSQDAKDCVGLFAKMFPFRLSLDPSMSLSAALAALDASFADDIRHQRFPLNHMIRTMEFRGARRSELFDLAVNYVRGDYSFAIGGAPVTCKNLSSGFPVAFSVTVFDHGDAVPMRFVLDCDQGRIPDDHAAAFFGCLERLLSAPLDAHEPLGNLSQELTVEALDGRDRAATVSLEIAPAATHAGGMTVKPPDDDIAWALLNMWRDRLQAPHATMTDDFFDLGGNSLKAMELAVDCNNCFGTDLPISTVFECPTVAEMANAVRAAAIGAARKSVVQLKAGAAASCCVFVHAIGGALFCYQELVARLHGAWPVYGLQPANMSSFAPASLEELARDYLAALDRTIADVPRYFAGWSFGGVVAFEMARQYGASGRSVLGVTLIDTPCRPEPWQGDDDRDILAAAGRVFGVGAAIDPPAGGDVRANEVIRSAAARAGLLIPTEQHIEHVVHLIRNVRRIRRDYRPGRLPTDVTLFRAVAEPQTQPPDFGWGDYVAGKLSVVSLPATHESILKMPHVERIAAHLDCVCSRDVAA